MHETQYAVRIYTQDGQNYDAISFGNHAVPVDAIAQARANAGVPPATELKMHSESIIGAKPPMPEQQAMSFAIGLAAAAKATSVEKVHLQGDNEIGGLRIPVTIGVTAVPTSLIK